ncbi:hypothetical protein [Saliniramus sp.]|uniref:hypothetical protein n=1 Tax=Saliniramus sp. TaxID=2986772 RepID=UPI002C1FA5AE|nr:hypothetical protein [Saliniramus sp.]HMB09592.1 hypothetical protein [Saliniramus sp.]
MHESGTSRSARKGSKRNDPKALLRFLEEMSWLLSSYEDLDFRAIGNLAEQIDKASKVTSRLKNKSIDNASSARLLTGVLPALMKDENLFPNNEDIVEFSEIALGISIPRWRKKSKFELIGHVVCTAEQADPFRLQRILVALDGVIDNHKSRQNLADQRASGLSWNEVIQGLLEG